MSIELEYRDKEAKILEDEYRKYELTVKNFESKIKIIESGRDDAFSKNRSLEEDLNKLRKIYTDKEIEYENKINQLIIEKSTLVKSNASIASENKKLLSEIALREQQLNKAKNDIYELTKSNDQYTVSFNDKLEEAKSNYFSEKRIWEREKNDLKNLVDDFTKQNESLKLKIAKMESDDIKYPENLKKLFLKTIDDIFKDKHK